MILAISGSLRRSSTNTAVLRAAAEAAARDGVEVVVSDWVRSLPHFDPDLEAAPPTSVVEFRSACEQAAGVLLAVPEYAFGIPGAFKNALDWTVGSGSLYRKPLAVIDVAPPGRGLHVQAALARVLTALDADVVAYSMPVASRDVDPDGELRKPDALDSLRVVARELAARATAAPRAA